MLSRLIFLFFFYIVIILVYIFKTAKASLERALEEGAGTDGILASPVLPIVAEAPLGPQSPLVIKIDSSAVDHVQ